MLQLFARLIGIVLLALAAGRAAADLTAPPVVRVGVLQFGTVGWSLRPCSATACPKAQGVDIRIVARAQRHQRRPPGRRGRCHRQ